MPARALALVVVTVLTAGACKRAPDAPTAAIDPQKYAKYLTAFPFGGQRPEWWETRLTELKTTNPALYALTLERAQKNGLVVDATGPQIHVRPGPDLAAVLIKRLEVK